MVWVPRSICHALTESFGDAQWVAHRSSQCTRCRIVPEVAILMVYKPVRVGGGLATSSSLSIACENSCVKSACEIILLVLDASSWTCHSLIGSDSIDKHFSEFYLQDGGRNQLA